MQPPKFSSKSIRAAALATREHGNTGQEWPKRLDLPQFWRNRGSCLPILTEQAGFASILTRNSKCWASWLSWVIYWSTCNRRVLCRLYPSLIFHRCLSVMSWSMSVIEVRTGKICFEQWRWSYTANNLRWIDLASIDSSSGLRRVIYSRACKERNWVLYCCKLS